MAGSTPNQFGVRGKDIPFKTKTEGNPVKKMSGTEPLRSPTTVKRATGKGK